MHPKQSKVAIPSQVSSKPDSRGDSPAHLDEDLKAISKNVSRLRGEKVPGVVAWTYLFIDALILG